MTWLKLIGALIAFVYGLCTVFQKRTPLYYRIVFFAMTSCFLGVGYYALAWEIWPEGVQGFHVGYFGSIGMYFFLYSSYYGAINTLADDGTPRFRRYRMAAFLVAAITALLAGVRIWMAGSERILSTLILIPAVATLYFACKHWIFPDVEMGIIDAMRPFNAVVFVLCLLQVWELCMPDAGSVGWVRAAATGILLAVSLPVAHRGVQRWFI